MSNRKTTKLIAKLLLVVVIVYVAVYGSVFVLRIEMGVDSPIVVVDGVSMNPTYVSGDMLVIKSVPDASQLQIGNVIIFHSPNDWNLLIVHRIVAIQTSSQLSFRTKGDNNLTNYNPDPFLVPAANILGVVVYKIPLQIIGSLILFTESITGRIILIVCVLFIVLDMFYDRKGGTTDESFIKEES
jgi:signal peptidase I